MLNPFGGGNGFMSFGVPGARENTCPDCGHYTWNHGKTCCLAATLNPDPNAKNLLCNCPCLRSFESFIAAAFDACYRI